MKWNDCNLIAFGFVLGAVSGGVLEAIIPISRTFFLGNDGRLQWETLVTGAFALAAAFVTALYLRKQIRQTQTLADDRRRRRERAALATLPLALSELSEYASSCIKELYDIRPYFKAGVTTTIDMSERQRRLTAWALPPLSNDLLSSLKECIEFADDAPAQAMISLIRHLQIQRTRLRDYISRAHGNNPSHLLVLANIEGAMYGAAEVHARASALFSFARGYPANSFGVTYKRIYEGLSLAGCFDDYDDISKLADKWQREAWAIEKLERQRTDDITDSASAGSRKDL